jgi:dUTP pyrophosphatase
MIEIIVLDKDLYSFADLGPKTLGSAGLDLKLARDAKPAMQLAEEGGQWPYNDLIPTGLKVRVPTNMVGLIVPRSSAGHKHGFELGNTIGVIDSDYRGELLISVGGGDYGKLKRGTAVAQLILVPYSSFYALQVVDEFSDADTCYGQNVRGAGGYGSTDAKTVLVKSEDWAVLPPTQRSVLGEARHEAGCAQVEEYQLSRLNGKW